MSKLIRNPRAPPAIPSTPTLSGVTTEPAAAVSPVSNSSLQAASPALTPNTQLLSPVSPNIPTPVLLPNLSSSNYLNRANVAGPALINDLSDRFNIDAQIAVARGAVQLTIARDNDEFDKFSARAQSSNRPVYELTERMTLRRLGGNSDQKEVAIDQVSKDSVILARETTPINHTDSNFLKTVGISDITREAASLAVSEKGEPVALNAGHVAYMLRNSGSVSKSTVDNASLSRGRVILIRRSEWSVLREKHGNDTAAIKRELNSYLSRYSNVATPNEDALEATPNVVQFLKREGFEPRDNATKTDQSILFIPRSESLRRRKRSQNQQPQILPHWPA